MNRKFPFGAKADISGEREDNTCINQPIKVFGLAEQDHGREREGAPEIDLLETLVVRLHSVVGSLK